jgi:hypothetical protein
MRRRGIPRILVWGVSQNKVNKFDRTQSMHNVMFWEQKCHFCLIFPGFDPNYPPFYFPRMSSFIIYKLLGCCCLVVFLEGVETPCPHDEGCKGGHNSDTSLYHLSKLVTKPSRIHAYQKINQ